MVTAESMETLRAEHADLAKRVDDRRAGMRVRTWKWPEKPDMPKFPDLPKLDEMPETMRRLYRDTDGRLRLREPFAQESDTPVPAASPTDAEALPSPRLGVTIEPLSDVLRDQLDLPEGGIVVREVLPRTLAERLGLRRNDVLLSVAGRSVSVAADVIGALAPVKEGEKLAVEIVRKSRRETLSVVR